MIKYILQSKLKIIFFGIFSIILFFAGFQNCSPTSFKSATSAETVGATGNPPGSSFCDPQNKPSTTNTNSCPTGSSGSGSTSTRTVTCVDNEWVTGAWSNPDFIGCSCSGGKTVNAVSGLCECPAGQVADAGGICSSSTCSPASQPNSADSQACPSGSGTSTRSRTVSCEAGAWNTGTWSNWNYSTCNCSISGQTPNTSTGICECAAGKILSGGSCITSSCNPATQPTSTENLSCPTGSSGTYSQTRSVTCDSSSNSWTTGTWSSNYSSCSCPYSGQTFDSNQNPACNCPTGTTLSGGSCHSTSLACPSGSKPTESQAILCPAPAMGSVNSTRTVTCNTTNNTWNSGAWNTNYSTCSCPFTGQTANSASGTCSCPTGQYPIATNHSCGTCPIGTTYNSSTKVCTPLPPCTNGAINPPSCTTCGGSDVYNSGSKLCEHQCAPFNTSLLCHINEGCWYPRSDKKAELIYMGSPSYMQLRPDGFLFYLGYLEKNLVPATISINGKIGDRVLVKNSQVSLNSPYYMVRWDETLNYKCEAPGNWKQDSTGGCIVYKILPSTHAKCELYNGF